MSEHQLDVIVTGGRDYVDYDTMELVLDWLKPTYIVHGGAKGADTLAGVYAAKRGIPVEVHKADWDQFGPAAGPRRNQAMLEANPNALVLAFPGGKGTANCVSIARAIGRPVLVVPA